MFKVKHIETGEIVQVLDTFMDMPFHDTYFLIWEYEGWRWRNAKFYVPPNVEVK